MYKDKKSLDRKTQVLIIEHDPALRKIMEISLEQAGVSVKSVSRYANAMQILQQEPPDVFVVDFDLRDGDPGRLITAYRQFSTNNNSAVMVSTSDRLEDEWRRKHKPDSVIYKPFDIRHLIRLISSLINNYRFHHV